MRFIIADRESIERGIPIREPYVVISIRDPGRRKARVPHPGHCRDILYLAFDDAEPIDMFFANQNIYPMTTQHAEEVLKFFRQHQTHVGAVLVQCAQGMSRSPAVAAALARSCGDDDSYFFKHYQPNQHVVRLMLDEATRTGDHSRDKRA